MHGMLDSMEKLSTNASQLVNAARSLVFPPACLFCQAPLADHDGCCSQCLPELHIWPLACCSRCGSALSEALMPGPCGRCLQRPPPQEQTCSLYTYAGPVRTAILEWKLHGREAGVRWLIDTAAPRLAGLIGSRDLLLPVPMPLSRMRASGQHHAANMCGWLAEISGAAWDWQLLRRVGEQPRQSSLSGAARRRNLHRAFSLADSGTPLHDVATVWVVDDILTTGSTLHHAARALLRLGKPVRVLSLARSGQRQ